jgi:hypothetical protein
VARRRGSSRPTPTSSIYSGSSSRTTCGSTSGTTIALEPEGDKTRLTYTEQGVHFDGLDSVEGREEGTRGLLEQLASHLAGGH